MLISGSATSHDISLTIDTPGYLIKILVCPKSFLGASYVKVSVIDNGKGIPEDVLDKIFAHHPAARGMGLVLFTDLWYL